MMVDEDGSMPDCSMREPRFETHCGNCLLWQPLHTVLGTGCTPFL